MSGLAAVLALVALTGCAASGGAVQAALAPRDHGLGPIPYKVGPLTVLLEAPVLVDQACRALMPPEARANRQLTYHGCYNPKTNTIISVADPYILLHEIKHHFEGTWHPPVSR